MGLLEDKSWLAQDFYNEYLSLKVQIQELILTRNHFESYNKVDEAREMQVKIDEKVTRLKFVLNVLKLECGVPMEDLILLSIGVDV